MVWQEDNSQEDGLMGKGRDICARSQGSYNKELQGLGEQVEGITECMELWTK